ncbi:MAG: Xaa-Pro peptidase family protein [Desulfobacterota bacterium]|jgi:Xaa-Pro aminopeptidase|nr:Xaa-Pro peptidase family protein [Thermodesulfobacteriota bacterium]
MREEFPAISRSLGFVYTPAEEIEARHTRLREKMGASGLDGFLVLQKMDCFYLSGTAQDALLYAFPEAKPLVLVKRELERARAESPLEHVAGLRSLRELPSLVSEHTGTGPRVLGVEMDILPARDYLRLQSLFPNSRLVDGSGILRDLRKVKSPFEIGLMRKAGDIGKRVYQEARTILKEGMTEIRFGGLLEAAAKSLGHEGLLRVRSFNYEAYSWHVLSGSVGGIVSQSDSPMGGLGLSPAFPVGASRKPMKASEPILVDFGICYHGYQADETRMFSIGKMPSKFADAYKACREIHDAVLADTRPGADCERLFFRTVELARDLGYEDSYLGPPGLQTKFIAHGIGLELNEYPFIAQGQSYPLEQGMTFAVEPKIVFPGEGSVGIENTVLVTETGCEILTPIDMEIIEV